MTRGQVIEKLRAEGFSPSPGRIRWALRTGYVSPVPQKDSRGANIFTPQHLKQLRRYFVRIRPGPRPVLSTEKFAITGPVDRLQRLARKKQRLRERGPSERVVRQESRREADAAIRCLERIARQLAS